MRAGVGVGYLWPDVEWESWVEPALREILREKLHFFFRVAKFGEKWHFFARSAKNGRKMALFGGALGIFVKKMRKMAKFVTKKSKNCKKWPF